MLSRPCHRERCNQCTVFCVRERGGGRRGSEAGECAYRPNIFLEEPLYNVAPKYVINSSLVQNKSDQLHLIGKLLAEFIKHLAGML